MVSPNTAATGRTALFVEIEVCDHDVGGWTTWRPADRFECVDVDGLLQQAIDAGFDDVRVGIHSTGSADE